jgi:hypothetical protein
MSNDMLRTLMGSGLRIENKSQLDEFIARPDAVRLVKAASFEEVFFTIKGVGLADSMDLLPLVSGRQVRGFIDLDCWRKDQFVRKPFMEWIAAFVQCGPEDTAKALSGIDEFVLALFLKDLIHVYEVDRDDPPERTEMILTPDSRFGVEPFEGGEPATIGMLILDALFKYNPHLGSRILTQVRYTSRLELEETAYENKTRRLEVHGFVDYYEAISIYAGGGLKESVPEREPEVEPVPGEETPGQLPTVFAASFSGATFLEKAFESVTSPEQSERVAQELTALGNRILSANLVNLGELEGVRPVLEEMKDTLSIGLEHLTAGHLDRAARVLEQTYVQAVFKTGFDQIVGLRDLADSIVNVKGFRPEMLDEPDREFLEALRRFKPLVIEDGRYRNFRSVSDVQSVHKRLEKINALVRSFVARFPGVSVPFSVAFNTASVRAVLYGQSDAAPLNRAELKDLERRLADGLSLENLEVPAEIRPFAERWWAVLREELEPLAGKPIDPRFIKSILVQL